MTEQSLLFGPAENLVGIVTQPAKQARRAELPAFVFLNAGVTHRVGPNRLYVRLARELAEDGFTSMRFDFSGLGDSAARTDDMIAWKSVVVETREAMDHLQQTLGIDRFVLIGVCSGATSSYITAREDPRVVGAVLINGQAHLHGTDLSLTDHLRARTLARHAWRIALRSSFRSKNLRKALAAQLHPGRILRMLFVTPIQALFGSSKSRQAPDAPDVAADLRAIGERGVRLFHLYCEGDEGLDYFHVVLGGKLQDVANTDPARFEIIRGANHIFSLIWAQEKCASLVRDWARSFASPTETGAQDR